MNSDFLFILNSGVVVDLTKLLYVSEIDNKKFAYSPGLIWNAPKFYLKFENNQDLFIVCDAKFPSTITKEDCFKIVLEEMIDQKERLLIAWDKSKTMMYNRGLK